MSILTRLRAEIDDFMAHHPQSPIGWEERGDFAGLNYYEEDRRYRFTVVLQLFPEDEPLIEMQTSTGDSRQYERWARFDFTVEGEAAALTIYRDPYSHDLFLPFKDATNGEETYGAGRYMDNHRPGLELVSSTEIEVDFNYCYNPYCAYNEAYSCPLPPPENWLKVPIRAGEKTYQ
jgi:uncharacterized protein (DUF1684 family)